MRLTEAFLKYVGWTPPPPLPEGAHRDNGHTLVTALVERNRQLVEEREIEKETVRLLLDAEDRGPQGS